MADEMSLSELIHFVGDDHVEIQNLAESLTRFEASKGDGLLTFATELGRARDLAMRAGKADYVPFVVWIPREALMAVTAPSTTRRPDTRRTAAQGSR